MKKAVLLLIVLISSSSILLSQSGNWIRLFDWDTYDVTMNLLNTDNLAAGGSGRLVFRTYDGGIHWDTLVVGYKGAAAKITNIIIHPVDTNAIICGGLMMGDIRRAEHQGTNPSDWKIVLTNNSNISLMNNSMILKEDDYNVMYIADGFSGVWYKSTDRGNHWDSLSTVMDWFKIADSSGNIVDSLTNIQVGCITERSDSTNIFFTGSSDGKIYMSKDNGLTWKKICKLVEPADSTQSTDCELTRIIFSKKNYLNGYACITYLIYKNYPNGGLYKTTDGGYSWHQIAFADTSISSIDVKTTSDGNDEVFVGGYTEDFYEPELRRPAGIGIVRGSYDGGKTWYNYDNQIKWHSDYPAYLHNIFSFAYINKDSIVMVGTNGFITRLQSTVFTQLDSNKIPINNNLNDIEFAKGNIGYICSDGGKVLKTITSGYPTPTDSFPWKLTGNTNISNDLNSIYIFDSSNVIACGSNGAIIKSTNGGSTWVSKNSNTNYSLYNIKFIDENTGFACGVKGTLIKTTDAGNSWSNKFFPSTDTLFSIKFTKSLIGFICTSGGQVYKSIDSGATWHLTPPTQVNTALHSIDFINDSTGFVCGYDGTLLVTNDGASSWNSKNLYTPRNFYQMKVINKDSAMFCGDFHSLFATTDGGANWLLKSFGWQNRANVWSMRFLGQPGKEKLFMAAEAGLFKFEEPTSVINPNDIQTYFNVFVQDKNNIIISYKRLNPNIENTLSFKLYNLIGQLVYRQDFNSSEPEIIKQEFILPNLPAGSYFAQIVETKFQSTKLVIIP